MRVVNPLLGLLILHMASVHGCKPFTQYFFNKTTCMNYTVCGTTSYQTVVPTQSTDRSCKKLTDCKTCDPMLSSCAPLAPPNQFINVQFTATSDRQCKAYSQCFNSTMFVSTLGTATSDNLCGPIGPECVLPSTQYAPPTATTDRVCAQEYIFLYETLNYNTNQFDLFESAILLEANFEYAAQKGIRRIVDPTGLVVPQYTYDLSAPTITPYGSMGTCIIVNNLKPNDLVLAAAISTWLTQGAQLQLTTFYYAQPGYRQNGGNITNLPNTTMSPNSGSASSSSSFPIEAVIVPCAVLALIIFIWFVYYIRKHKQKKNIPATAGLPPSYKSTKRQQRQTARQTSGSLSEFDMRQMEGQMGGVNRSVMHNVSYDGEASPARPVSQSFPADPDLIARYADVPFYEPEEASLRRRSQADADSKRIVQEEILRQQLEQELHQTTLQRQLDDANNRRSLGINSVASYSSINSHASNYVLEENAPGCPNVVNPFHRCTNWCAENWAHLVKHTDQGPIGDFGPSPAPQGYIGPALPPPKKGGFSPDDSTFGGFAVVNKNRMSKKNNSPGGFDLNRWSDTMDQNQYEDALALLDSYGEDPGVTKTWSADAVPSTTLTQNKRQSLKGTPGLIAAEVDAGYMLAVAGEGGYFEIDPQKN